MLISNIISCRYKIVLITQALVFQISVHVNQQFGVGVEIGNS